MQHELGELKKKFIEQRGKYDNVDESHRNLIKLYKELCLTVEALGKDLTLERNRCAELEKQLQQGQFSKNAEVEVWNHLLL